MSVGGTFVIPKFIPEVIFDQAELNIIELNDIGGRGLSPTFEIGGHSRGVPRGAGGPCLLVC